MTLAPETRNLLTDALRPPLGHRMDIAAATTYSLDLPAILLAPLTFALQDHSGDIDDVDPIATLESVRRYAEQMTVFCQGGAIHPARYRSILTFVEDAVIEVGAPRDGALFHPKVWAIRFVDGDGDYLHRCLVLSRNLTFDNSWDTILSLDETTEDGLGISGHPLGRFVAELPDMAAKPFDPKRRQQIADLAGTLGRTRFEVPAPYSSGEIMPLGMPWSEPLKLPKSTRLLVVSPFVSAQTLNDLTDTTRELRLLSRPNSLDALGELGAQQAFVLDDTVEQDPANEVRETTTSAGAHEASVSKPPASERTPPMSGLHAKFYISEYNHAAEIVTGSANATAAGFDGNVEVVVRMHGPRSKTGVESIWDGTPTAPGLARYVTPYTPQPVSDDDVVAEQNAWTIDHWHAALSRSTLRLSLHDVTADGTAHLTLTAAEHRPPEGCRSHVRPLSLPQDVEDRELAPTVRWGPVSISRVTPFLVVTTRLGRGSTAVTRSRVIKAELVGDVPERRHSALRETLRSGDDVMRYLMFLLGDPAAEGASMGEQLRRTWGRGTSSGGTQAVVFEPLIRAVAAGEESLGRVAAFFDELDAAAADVVPQELQELWAVVNEVRGESR